MPLDTTLTHNGQLVDAYLHDDPSTKSCNVYAVLEDGGVDLKTFFERQTDALTNEQIRLISRQICAAMAYLHSCRVVHRDIKPQNILIDDRPDSPTYLHVRIADFGLSRAVELPPGTLPTPPPSPSGASALPSPRLIRKSQSEANFLAGISNCEFRTVFGEDGDHACVELGLERLALADDFQRNGSEPMCVRMLCALELSQVKRA